MLLRILHKFTRTNQAPERVEVDTKFLKTVGVRNEADQHYRQRRLEQMRLRENPKTADALEDLYDTWVVDELPGSVPVYFARPFWDDYPELTRPSFDSRAEAFAHIRSLNGRPLPH